MIFCFLGEYHICQKTDKMVLMEKKTNIALKLIFLSNYIIIILLFMLLLFDSEPKCIFNVDIHKFVLCVRLLARISSRIPNLLSDQNSKAC